jgi:hypothetical protein
MIDEIQSRHWLVTRYSQLNEQALSNFTNTLSMTTISITNTTQAHSLIFSVNIGPGLQQHIQDIEITLLGGLIQCGWTIL